MHFSEAEHPPADWNEIPLALRPNGGLLHEYSLLPELPAPSRIVVGRDYLEIDGWIFAYHLFSRALLLWLQKTCQSWRMQDPSESHQQWVAGVVDVFTEACIQANMRRQSGAG